MNEEIFLDLEKSLFLKKYMSDEKYLNKTLHTDFLECGKSGRLFNKNQTIADLLSFTSDRKIDVYNFTSKQINPNTVIVHYITKNNEDNIYRTSIWIFEDNWKLIYHQATKLEEKIELKKF